MGLSTVQVVGVAIGAIFLILLVFIAVVVAVKRLMPGCKNFRFSAPHDTQILVIDGPEDGSDMEDDEDDERDEDHDIESA